MRYLGSFVLQDMLLSLHIFAFDGQNLKFSERAFADGGVCNFVTFAQFITFESIIL